MSNVKAQRSNQFQSPNFKDYCFSVIGPSAGGREFDIQNLCICLTFEFWHLEFFKNLSSQSLFELLLHHRDNGKEISDDAIAGNFKDGSLRVLIDGHDDI